MMQAPTTSWKGDDEASHAPSLREVAAERSQVHIEADDRAKAEALREYLQQSVRASLETRRTQEPDDGLDSAQPQLPFFRPSASRPRVLNSTEYLHNMSTDPISLESPVPDPPTLRESHTTDFLNVNPFSERAARPSVDTSNSNDSHTEANIREFSNLLSQAGSPRKEVGPALDFLGSKKRKTGGRAPSRGALPESGAISNEDLENQTTREEPSAQARGNAGPNEDLDNQMTRDDPNAQSVGNEDTSDDNQAGNQRDREQEAVSETSRESNSEPSVENQNITTHDWEELTKAITAIRAPNVGDVSSARIGFLLLHAPILVTLLFAVVAILLGLIVLVLVVFFVLLLYTPVVLSVALAFCWVIDCIACIRRVLMPCCNREEQNSRRLLVSRYRSFLQGIGLNAGPWRPVFLLTTDGIGKVSVRSSEGTSSLVGRISLQKQPRNLSVIWNRRQRYRLIVTGFKCARTLDKLSTSILDFPNEGRWEVNDLTKTNGASEFSIRFGLPIDAEEIQISMPEHMDQYNLAWQMHSVLKKLSKDRNRSLNKKSYRDLFHDPNLQPYIGEDGEVTYLPF